MRGFVVTGSRSSLASVAQRAAQETVREMSPRLVSEPLVIPWVSEIYEKVGSIVGKEVVPLLTSRIAIRDRKRLMQSVGSILGVTYLADYALENRFGFRIDDAAEHVLSTARAIGVDERFANEEIKRLRDLYRHERSYASDRTSARSAEARYLLKSSDVVFVQLLVLRASEEGAGASAERALRFAGAALDVYDDLVDREEDAGRVVNPFDEIRAGRPDRLRSLFRELVTPYMKSIKEFAVTASDGVVGRYCGQVLSRLSLRSLSLPLDVRNGNE